MYYTKIQAAGLLIALLPIFSVAQAHTRPYRQDQPARTDTTTVQVKDPVCGMKVKLPFRISSVWQGRTFGFCNASCKARFDKNPSNYTKNNNRKH